MPNNSYLGTTYISGNSMFINSRPVTCRPGNNLFNRKKEWSAIRSGEVPGAINAVVGAASGIGVLPTPRQWACNEWSFSCDPARPFHWSVDNPAQEDLGNGVGASPTMNYRFNAEVTTPAGHVHNVPGFYAGNGSGVGIGNVWNFRYAPSSTGSHDVVIRYEWHSDLATYKCFNVTPLATSGTHTPWPCNHAFSFTAIAKSAANLGFFASGLLQASGDRYMKFSDGTDNYFVKGGANSPENLLAYKGFDAHNKYGGGIGSLHEYSHHASSWESGDPTWTDNNPEQLGAEGIIGLINDFNMMGTNSIYFLPMNLGGDGRDTYPFVHLNPNDIKSDEARFMYDISKLDQWSDFFSHCQEKEQLLHFLLAERENSNVTWLDDPNFWEGAGVDQSVSGHGGFGVFRKLFYRQMIAWFSCYPAMQWTLCEEQSASGHSESGDPGDEYQLSSLATMGQYIYDNDPYKHSIGIHTDHDELELYQQISDNTNWGDFSGWFSHTSIQYDPDKAGEGAFTDFSGAQFLVASANDIFQRAVPAKSIVISLDEYSPAGTWPGKDTIRKKVTWDTYLCSGIQEYYLGGRDQSMDDWTGDSEPTGNYNEVSGCMQESKWARNLIMSATNYWQLSSANARMTNDDEVFGGASVACTTDASTFIVYWPRAGADPGDLDLSNNVGAGQLTAYWYNPRTGNFEGDSSAITTPVVLGVAEPPNTKLNDWALILV